MLQYLLRRWRKIAATPLGQVPLSSEWLSGVYRDSVRRPRLTWRAARGLRYLLYLPEGRTRAPVPLLVMLHGCTQDAAEFAAGTRMNAAAQEQGCAVLYPEQTSNANAMRCWNWFDPAAQRGQGEAGLIARLVQDVMRHHPIDAQRVYVAGMSAGAAMAEVLALRYPQLFAASAVHSGLMFAAASDAGDALRSMRLGAGAALQATAQRLAQERGRSPVPAPPVLVIHGSADRTVNPRNATEIVALRLALVEAPPAQAALPAPDRDVELKLGGRTTHQRDYNAGKWLAARSLLVDGLGHAWSGGDAQYPFNDASGPDASRIILEFLLQQRAAARA